MGQFFGEIVSERFGAEVNFTRAGTAIFFMHRVTP